jgi:hypothetical protein
MQVFAMHGGSMSSEEKKDGPDYRDTKQLPAVKVPVGQMDELVLTVKSFGAKLDTVITGQVELTTRMSRAEAGQVELRGEISELRARQDAGSLRAKAPSAHDLSAAAAIAAEATARAERDEQLAKDVGAIRAELQENTFLTKKAISGFAKEHPQLMTAIVGFVMAALGAATHWLSAGGH